MVVSGKPSLSCDVIIYSKGKCIMWRQRLQISPSNMKCYMREIETFALYVISQDLSMKIHASYRIDLYNRINAM